MVTIATQQRRKRRRVLVELVLLVVALINFIFIAFHVYTSVVENGAGRTFGWFLRRINVFFLFWLNFVYIVRIFVFVFFAELPETSFTRSISNPEAVMRRRRQQILERKLQQFRSKDGGPDTGGTLKIYGESLCRDVPYKTLLLSIRDTAQQVVREMLMKYGLEKEDPHNYCLVQVSRRDRVIAM